jgi:maltooligosyltrehalose trehalohydrolase
MSANLQRRFAVGAEASSERATHFRVWAPRALRIAVVEHSQVAADDREHPLSPEGNGYYSGWAPLRAGDRYRFRIDDQQTLYPDPASRFQPEGPHGPSQVVDPSSFAWGDAGFRENGDARVIYELHLGTFTPEGTYQAAGERMKDLASLGVTVVELMPVNGFPGDFNWGYDGVNTWAPAQVYGSPEELRAFVASAHAQGIAVILDVVYNHFGGDGCYLGAFSKAYFTDRYECEWGEAINFDGPESAPVREYFCENARYWIEEFHLDGLRLDATQAIFDSSETHVIVDIVRAARTAGQKLDKHVYIVAENEPQNTRIVRAPGQAGYGVDALWNDDFHHSAVVALTGHTPAYYSDYRGSVQELISALKWGYLFQGQHYFWQKKNRGTPALDLRADNFVTYLQNHDQIANSISGSRIDRLTSGAELRAMTALLLLAPPTPMLFQGQEFAASTPFLFFADQPEQLAAVTARDRREFLAQFPNVDSLASGHGLDRPALRETFERCKLDWSERERHAPIYALHRDLLRLRREDPAIRQRRADLMHGAVLAERCFALRFFCPEGDRLLLVNLGPDLALRPLAEPLVAPPAGHAWALVWFSEDLKYGGQGFGRLWSDGKLELVARSSALFTAVERKAEPSDQ